MACMTDMPVAFVYDLQKRWCERRLKFFLDLLCQ